MNKRYAFTGILLVSIIVTGVLWIKKNQPSFIPTLDAAVSGKVKGAQNALVRIEEYSDFQCPACQKAQPLLSKILSDYSGKVQLIFHHFPLPMHRWAALSHQATECANQAGRFWEYHDRMYAEQPNWSQLPNPTEAFLGYARDLAMELDPFARCLADTQVTQQIQEEKREGDKLKVSSTPTFFINGQRFVGTVELENRGIAFIREILGLTPLPAPTADGRPSTVDRPA